MEIIPAILTNNPEELKEKLAQVEGLVKRIQIDIIDGVFANNKTLNWGDWGDFGNIKLDIHLMVDNPASYLEIDAQNVDRVIGQIEKMPSQKDFVEQVFAKNYLSGLAIDVETPVVNLDTTVLSKLDVVLVMSVPAGFGGQPFHPEVLEKSS